MSTTRGSAICHHCARFCGALIGICVTWSYSFSSESAVTSGDPVGTGRVADGLDAGDDEEQK
ncbi:MAG: hypothetical protein ACKVK8_09825 [Rhodospirillales bacterium]